MQAARVLVVEDEPVLRETVAAALAAAGFAVPARADGRDLDGTVERFRPDAAVLDIPRPGRTGSRWRGGCARSARSRSSSSPPGTRWPTGWPASRRVPTTTW